jgi:hypothetical protein
MFLLQVKAERGSFQSKASNRIRRFFYCRKWLYSPEVIMKINIIVELVEAEFHSADDETPATNANPQQPPARLTKATQWHIEDVCVVPSGYVGWLQ